MLCNIEIWEEIEEFGLAYHEMLKKYFKLENGIPSHDTIQRVIAMFSAKYFDGYRAKFNELLNCNEGEKIRKILAIDGKTQRGNGNAEQKANHIVSCVDNNGFCLGDTCVNNKSKC